MTLDYVEQHPILDAIREFMCTYFQVEYNKSMRLYLDDTSYVIYISLNNTERPLMMGGDFESDEDFIHYIEGELKKRKLHFIKYFSGYMVNQPIIEEVGVCSPRGQQLIAEDNEKRKRKN